MVLLELIVSFTSRRPTTMFLEVVCYFSSLSVGLVINGGNGSSFVS